MLLRLIPDNTKIDFLGKKYLAFLISGAFILITIFLLVTRGLNFGIDFTGGILIDAKFEQKVDLQKMRGLLKDADIGDISLQTLGEENDVLIRIGQTSEEQEARVQAINTTKSILKDNFGENIDYRKVDYVGPKVGGELILDGALSLLLAVAAIMVYIWLRFEWQFGVGAIVAILHDSVLTLGFFSYTQLEFNLSSVAAVLTIIGYSINDTVVVFDRIRENLRKYKKMPLTDILNISINDTLSRTILTALTTLLVLLALVFLGGDVIKSFSLAALFGIAVGTYSSIYIASPILIFMKIRADETKAVSKS